MLFETREEAQALHAFYRMATLDELQRVTSSGEASLDDLVCFNFYSCAASKVALCFVLAEFARPNRMSKLWAGWKLHEYEKLLNKNERVWN